jgi:hypothetical protein
LIILNFLLDSTAYIDERSALGIAVTLLRAVVDLTEQYVPNVKWVSPWTFNAQELEVTSPK